MYNQKDIAPELFQEIRKYLSDKMTPVEKMHFEASLRNNPELKAEVETTKELLLAVELGGLKASLKNRHTPTVRLVPRTEEEIDTGEGPRYWFALAASILAVIAVGTWVLFQKPPINQQLFSQYATQDPGLPVPMSTTTEYVFYDAMVDYKRQEYTKAIEKWRDLHTNAPNNDTLNYFMGAAHFNSEHYELAIPFFENTLATRSLAFSAKSQWFLALSYLKTEEYEKIDILVNEALPPYRLKIQDIQQSLNNAR